MSLIKRHAEELDAKRQVAESIALETGLLERCESCEDITHDGLTDPTDTYKLANYLITKGDERVAIFNGDRRELTDTIQAILDDYGPECYCEQQIQAAIDRDD